MDGPTGGSRAQPEPSRAPFVVGLGASAGGIEALKAFFTHIPPKSGTAFVVILHLSPDHDSHLAEVLQHAVSIPVTQVKERVLIEPDHVYVVPPSKLLTIDRQSIVVSDMTRMEQRRSPVDLFFRSLADAQGSHSVCVVLSGTGSNGSIGLKRVKEYGGLVIAQDPDEAGYAEMPRNAMATGMVDFVLPVAEIPAKIHAYHERLRQDGGESAETAPILDPEAMREILGLLQTRTGHDFSSYKPATIKRRVERRMHLQGLASLSAYASTIRENPDEGVSLMKELLISVTNFFRDTQAYQALAERVIPRIFHNKTAQDHVRIWVAACASGEEAYSIAIQLAEHAAASNNPPVIQIFATDLDAEAVARARDGLYTDAEVADVSEDRLLRFFTREQHGYRIRRDLRETVLFAHHNLIKDPPFSHIDLISCRNLLIYLNRTVQERVFEVFHFALKPGGYLFLGTSESPDGSSDLFSTLDKTAHIYESRGVATRVAVPVQEDALLAPRVPGRASEVRPVDRISPGELHQRLLERYAPPSAVITEEHIVVHLSERVGRFMQVGGGEPTRDLLRMIRDDLRPDLRSALHEAVWERRVIEVKDVAAALEDGQHFVDITVYPVLRDSDPARGYLLVTFDERDVERSVAEARQLASPPTEIADHLEEELSRVKQQLRATIEQYETQAEESKASNEELQAVNEELRSAAEELETSKEELQSVNEELSTVNQELKIKIDELAIANSDFQNLIISSDIGTIFLDRDLRVKMSTPAANQVFNLLRTDVGRPLSDITNHLKYLNLHDDVRQVLEDLRTIDREIQLGDGRWTLTRIRPYRTTDDRIDGVVITFQDITERRRAEERLRLLIDGATDYAIYTMTNAGVIDSWNTGAERMFGYRADEIVGQPVEVLFTPEDRAAGVPAAELARANESGRISDNRFQVRRDGARFSCHGSTIGLGADLGFAKIARDLSVQQQAAETLSAVQANFESRVRERTDQLEAEVIARDAAHHRITDLLRKIVTAQEDERARIARDLHDQLGQQLTALRLGLQRYRDRLRAAGSVDEDVDRALAVAGSIEGDLDFLAWELRPAVLDDLGLAAALPHFVREWSEHYRIPAEYRSGGFAAGQLSRDAEVVFYRVAQEALNNVTKHGHASRVDVMLESRDRSVLLVVEDDGVGFDPGDKDVREQGIGIVGMQERASLIGATLQIESRPGEGTSIFLRCTASDGAAAERLK
jgi:two-component system, chemotaxis family, CheB/CheR fusion protein